jgi:putative serine protease PepD
MNEEQRPPEGPDEQAAEEFTAPVNLEHTVPLVNYPPPAGSPFVHESPPSGSPFVYEPPPSGSPYAHQPPPPVDPASLAASGVYPSTSWPPESDTSVASPVTTGSPGRRGLGGLGAGVISTIVAGSLAIAMVAALFGGIVGALLVSRRDGGSASLPVPPAGSAARPAGSIADIAARILPSVVTIKVKGPSAEGTGSGFVLRKDGYILTNNHVVAAAITTGTITVLFSDGKSAEAKIIGRDDSYDLAVVRVDRRDLPVLALGVSSTVVVGDPVIAVGAPLGLDSTVTSGIVSALNRPVTAGGAGDSTASFINAIQTDAAINPGNSGGPLLDMAGRVIGVNSAIARVASSDTPFGGQSGNIGVGFAIPSDQVRKTAEQLIANGKATHPVIGVMIDTVYSGEGVRIATASKNGTPPITKGGPADKAGLKPGDVILKFAGRVVTDPDEFVVAIRAKSAGDEVELTVRRGTTVRTVKMTLQAAN